MTLQLPYSHTLHLHHVSSPGYGAGMTLQLPNSHTFHLTVLYSSSKQERENQPDRDRLARNRMLNQQRSSQGEEAVSYELQPALQQLCHTLNGFIFVVDASGTKQSGEGTFTRLFFVFCCRHSSFGNFFLGMGVGVDGLIAFLNLPVCVLVCRLSGMGCSSVGRALDCHTADTGSILQCGKGLSSQSTFSALSFSVHPPPPHVQSHALTSVCMLKIL